MGLVLKKSWVWCKHHWKILLIAIWTIVVWFVARKRLTDHKQILDTAIQSYKSEIEIIQKSHEQELERRDRSIETYQLVIKEAEKSYEDSQQDLDIIKRERLKALVNQYTDDPENLNAAIEAEFGFRYVK